MSPGLTLLLLSSVQPGAVQFYPESKGWHVILFNYVIPVIRTGREGTTDRDRGQIDRTNQKRGRQESSVASSYLPSFLYNEHWQRCILE